MAHKFLQIISGVLIFLFAYTAFSKTIDTASFRAQMLNQPLPSPINHALVWLIPALELITCALLMVKPWRVWGLTMSLALMVAFIAYIALILANAFAFIPCSCGGITSSLSWQQQLAVNIVFAVAAMFGIHLHFAAKRP